MGQVRRQEQPRVFEVLVSFDGLDKGGVFSVRPDELGWALQHAETGYLRDITEQEEPDERSGEGQR